MKRPFFAGIIFISQASAAGTVESRMLDARGVRIHYPIADSREPVVLINGPYSSVRINGKHPGILATLAEDHQVIALDLPEYGLSD